jgi:hypothetical protein
MKTEKTAPLTLDEVLAAAINFEIKSVKSTFLDQDIHRKFKSILSDFDMDNLNMQKLINTILSQWIQDHKMELESKLLEKVKRGY